MPKISAIIPVYNAEDHLAECLDSILTQTLKEIEIVIIDDGSTDQSQEILRQYASKDVRIQLHRQENAGAGAARNLGIRNASGEFVIFIDADDRYPTAHTLEHLYAAAVQHNVSIAGGSFSRWTNGEIQTRFHGNFSGYTFMEEGLIDYRDYQFDYGYHRFIYRRDMLVNNKIYFPDYRRFQDPPFFVYAMIAAERFYAIREVVYCYRVSDKAIEWNERKTADLALGLMENLQIARDHRLAKLHALTVSRIDTELAKILTQGLRAQNEELFQILMQTNLLVDLVLLEEAGLHCSPPYVLAPLKKMLLQFGEQEDRNDPLEEKLASVQGELDTIKHSVVYRLVNYLLWIPRRVKQFILKKKLS